MTTLVVGGAGLAAAAGAVAVAGAVGLGLAGLAAVAGRRRQRRGKKTYRRRYGRQVTDDNGEKEALERLMQVIREEDVSGCGRLMVCHLAASDPSQLLPEHLAVLQLLEPGKAGIPGDATGEYLRASKVGVQGGDCTLAFPTCTLTGPQVAQQAMELPTKRNNMEDIGSYAKIPTVSLQAKASVDQPILEGNLVMDEDFGSHLNDCSDSLLDVNSDCDNFEELLNLVGTDGRWNFMMIFLCASAVLPTAMQSMSYQFLGHTPDHWCMVPDLIAANWTQHQIISLAVPIRNDTGIKDSCKIFKYNYSLAVEIGYNESMEDTSKLYQGERTTLPCTSRYFNTTYTSTVTQWDLVCERRYLYTATFSACFLNLVINCPFTGIITDMFGRCRILVFATLVYSTCCFLASIAPNYHIYILLRVLITLLGSYSYFAAYVLSVEVCSVKQRSMVGNLFIIPWAVGYMMLPCVAYLVQDWRWMQAALSVPSLLLLTYYWLICESPRWLINNGRLQEAADVLTKAAKMNKRNIPSKQYLMATITALYNNQRGHDGIQPVNIGKCRHLVIMIRKGLFSVWNLVASIKRASVAFTILFMWFVCGVNYYGVSFSSPNLNINQYLYSFLSGLLEVPAFLMLWPIVANFGRKRGNILLHLLCAICMLLIPIIQTNTPLGSHEIIIVLALLGKLGVTAAFALAYLITAEVYPTLHRSLTICIAYIPSAFGASVATYINDLLALEAWWAPTVVFGVLAFTTSILTLLLPETYKNILPEIIPAGIQYNNDKNIHKQ